jgi:hypothetical protein
VKRLASPGDSREGAPVCSFPDWLTKSLTLLRPVFLHYIYAAPAVKSAPGILLPVIASSSQVSVSSIIFYPTLLLRHALSPAEFVAPATPLSPPIRFFHCCFSRTTACSRSNLATPYPQQRLFRYVTSVSISVQNTMHGPRWRFAASLYKQLRPPKPFHPISLIALSPDTLHL